ncbi:hypothetical protein LTQ03_05180 [Vibrio splendidus]|uniref:DUF6701 domain-containing protein n=1 Tax=Vibrio splendidus TaxID=29497 RepID=UPI001FB3ABEC|nr:DUF6701 domain-containing protein [Vibrio splendidus]UOE80810.1 hypothetical protein LTQ03_05180 [Vibrio splendidus]
MDMFSRMMSRVFKISVLLIVLFTSSAHALTVYNLANKNEFDDLCSGTTSKSGGNPKLYTCNGRFTANYADIRMSNGDTLYAISGYDVSNSSIDHHSGSVTLTSSNGGFPSSTFNNVFLKGDINVYNGISFTDSIAEGFVKTNSYEPIVISNTANGYSTTVEGYVEGYSNIDISSSTVNGYVKGLGSGTVLIQSSSTIADYVEAKDGKIDVNSSTVQGDVNTIGWVEVIIQNSATVNGSVDSKGTVEVLSLGSIRGDASAAGNLSINNATVQGSIRSGNGHLISVSNNATVQGNVDAGATITIQDSDVVGDVSNRSGNPITIQSDSSIGGNVDAGATITIQDSDVVGDVSNRSGNPITIQSDSSIGGNVDAGATITIQDSDVVGDVSNRSGNPITIQSDSSIGGNVDAGTAITIQDSDVIGDVSNRGNNPVKIQSDSFIDGNIDSQGELIIEDSEVQGNINSANSNIELDTGAEIHGNATAANNNWATIYFKDYNDSGRSIVHGTCLYRTDPEGACGPVDPPINQNPQFEFGTLTKDSCRIIEPDTNDDADRQRVSCTLEFDKTYTTVPLVFVMPTIDASLSVKNSNNDGGTTELPSTASVIGTSLTSATIVQEIAPSAKRNTSKITYLDAPMLSDEDLNSLNIDYFVIQEGVISLGNGRGKIVAGLVPTKTAASQVSGERYNADLIEFEDYGLSSFTNTPGVLVQPQTKKNGSSSWFTGMARGVNKERFYLALEKSEVINNNDINEPEKVAFVAGEGSGITQGARFFLGSGETRVTTTLNEKIISPIEIGCIESTPISEANFDAPPILVANKNSRIGNNGGWVRRCDVTKDEVYFIVEEDMDKDSERSHVAENVGFFMFDRPSELGVCDGFNNKSPAQTWQRIDGTFGTFEANSTSSVVGSFKDGSQRYVGFDQNAVTDNTNGACDGVECHGLEDLMVPKELLEDIPDNLEESITVNSGESITLPITSGGSVLYEYQELKVNDGGVVTIAAGKYKIGKITINGTGEVSVKVEDTVTIFTNDFKLNSDANFGIPIESWTGDNPNLVANTYLRVNVLEQAGSNVVLNTDSVFVGLLYSEQDVKLNSGSQVYGAISAKSIQMNGDSLIHAETSCILPSDSYEIELSPALDTGLMCGIDDYLPNFTIYTKSNDEYESLAGEINIGSDFDIVATVGTIVGSKFVSDTAGEFSFRIEVNTPGNVDIDTTYQFVATLNDDTDQQKVGDFKFVPFEFSVPDQSVYAGQIVKNVAATVAACDENNAPLVVDYSGTPAVSAILEKPMKADNDSSDLIDYAPTFSNGTSTANFSIDESGQFTATLTGGEYDCTGLIGCPASGKLSLTGSFNIDSRPWKIAICDVLGVVDDKSNPASTTEYGSYFIPSGEEFEVIVKPIVHPDYYDLGSVPSNECDFTTTNYYYVADNNSAPLSVNFDIEYPTGGDISNLANQENRNYYTTYSFQQSDISEGVMQKTLTFTWNEVGTISMFTNADYLGQAIEEDDQVIGRFYPKYFSVTGSNTWDYPGAGISEQNYAYMNQPFEGVEFEVIALNANGDDVVNYHQFPSDDNNPSDKLTANFSLYEPNNTDYDGRFFSPQFSGTWREESGSSIGTFSLSDSAPSTTCSDELCWSKASVGSSYEDGPLNQGGDVTSISLTAEGVSNSDPIAYIDDESRKLSTQPELLFGRIQLDSIGGNTEEELTIPLRVEFWNGSRFIVNTDDDFTNITGSESDEVVIWSEGGAITTTVTLDDGGDVSNGQSRNITAEQAPGTVIREQVQLWQDMTDTPWLRYNWNSELSGEEDPSTVVTFGIYKGNDRVIYRGESGLTGQ